MCARISLKRYCTKYIFPTLTKFSSPCYCDKHRDHDPVTTALSSYIALSTIHTCKYFWQFL